MAPEQIDEKARPKRPMATPVRRPKAGTIGEFVRGRGAVAPLGPPLHWLLYGPPGAGKTESLATFPTPGLVFFFDAIGKDMPLLRRGTVTGFGEYEDGIKYRHVLDDAGDLLWELRYFHDPDPEHPTSYGRFEAHVASLVPTDWATVGFDSVTSITIASLGRQRFVLNPAFKDPRKWRGEVTDELERTFMRRISGWIETNVVVCCHVDEYSDDVSGMVLRNPAAPGRLRTGLASAFSEFYHAYATTDDKGQRVHVWQTRPDAYWNAITSIDAPDPCAPTYSAIWENWGA